MKKCANCGRERPYHNARVDTADGSTYWLCHDGDEPTCYMRSCWYESANGAWPWLVGGVA